ncbi:MAG: SLC13 family permease [Acidimicrobiia bacterium]|nr:SLC13 family permease [Acidimicrobiia bacterium]
MTADAWVTLAVILATLALLVTERVPPSVAMFGAVVVLLLLRVIEPEQALSGFANEAPFTVAALYVMSGALEATGATAPLMSLFGTGKGVRRSLLRVTGGAGLASSVMANTTVVASFAPVVSSWARRRGLSPSRFLMPLSFAALLGGLVTAIGTSTNITVSGLLQASGQKALGFFEVTWVGLPVAVIGLGVLVLTAPLLLRRRRDVFEEARDESKQFTVEMIVTEGPLGGRSVEDAGLRHLQGVFLVQVERGGNAITPVAPDEILQVHDRLLFAGDVNMIVDLQTMRGLESAESHHFDFGDGGLEHLFFEAVIGAESPLAGQTLKSADFRGKYGAAVVAIHRAGEAIHAKLGEVVLRPGDVLLILSHPGFRTQWAKTSDFLVIAPVGGTSPVRTSKAWLVYLLLAAFIVVSGAGLMSLLEAALLVVLLMVALRVISPREARRFVDINIVILIAASFGLGEAAQRSGLAETLAQGLVSMTAALGPTGALAGIFIGTAILTAMISNNAAAVLMFPIGMAAAAEAGFDMRAAAMAVLVAASTDFLTPIGYQTNTMVLGMGGYRFTDFARLGFPLTLVTFVVSLVVIPLVWR